MNRQEKAEMIETLAHGFKDSEAAFIVGYQGLTVSQLTNLRKKLRQQHGQLQVAKVTLIKRAAKQMEQNVSLDDHMLEQQIAIVFAQKEVPSVAKVVCDFSKETPNLKVVGGCLGAQALTSDQIEMYAQLPSREVLLARLCGMLKAPIAQLARVLHLHELQLSGESKQGEEQK